MKSTDLATRKRRLEALLDLLDREGQVDAERALAAILERQAERSERVAA